MSRRAVWPCARGGTAPARAGLFATGRAAHLLYSEAVDPRDPIIQFILFVLLMLAPLWLLGC